MIKLAKVVNVYDFDKTIYDGRSCVDFFFFCLKKYPKLIKYAIRNLYDLYKIEHNLLDLEKTKVNYCDFFNEVKDIQKVIEEFWNKYECKIKTWYLDQKSEDDIIVTASPDFLIEPICKRLNLKNYIATTVDIKNGNIIKLCFKKNKKILFKEKYSNVSVKACYTDNLEHDKELLSLAKEKYLVKKDKIIKIRNYL